MHTAHRHESARAMATINLPAESTSSTGGPAMPDLGAVGNVDAPMQIDAKHSEEAPPQLEASVVVVVDNTLQAQAKAKAELLKRYKNDVLQLYDLNVFADRMRTLISAWRSVVILLDSTTPDACDNVMHLVLRHTLHTMLMGQWATTTIADRTYIRQQIETCIPLVESCSQNSLHRCRYILAQLDQPWEHPILRSLMGLDDDDADEAEASSNDTTERQEVAKFAPDEFVQLPSQSVAPARRPAEGATNDPTHPLAIRIAAEIEYLTSERGCMIALRLQKLCESRLYEMACTLAARTLRALRSCPSRHPLRRTTSPSQIGYIHDLYLVLLYRLGKYVSFLDELRSMDLQAAVGFAGRNPPQREQAVNRLVPLYEPVLDTALQVFLTRFLSTKLAGNQTVQLRGLCLLWVRRNNRCAHFWKHWRHLVTLCDGYQHFYVLLDALVESFPNHKDLKEEKLEMLCRGMTHELNELEHMKTDHMIDAHRIFAAECQIAPRFLALADMFQDFQEMARELILTSFSLHPTETAFERIQHLAESSFHTDGALNAIRTDQAMALVLQCPIHDVAKADAATTIQTVMSCESCGCQAVAPKVFAAAVQTDVTQRVGSLHSVTGSGFINMSAYDAVTAPNLILDAIEVLSAQSRHDLLTLISAPRIKNLSWLMTWPELQRNCTELLRTPAKINRIEHTVAAANDHLQFLHPDFDRYRHLAQHQYPGIESGYEMFYRDEDDDAIDYLHKLDKDDETASASETEREMADMNAKQKKRAQLAARKRKRYAEIVKVDPVRTTKEIAANYRRVHRRKSNAVNQVPSYQLKSFESPSVSDPSIVGTTRNRSRVRSSRPPRRKAIQSLADQEQTSAIPHPQAFHVEHPGVAPNNDQISHPSIIEPSVEIFVSEVPCFREPSRKSVIQCTAEHLAVLSAIYDPAVNTTDAIVEAPLAEPTVDPSTHETIAHPTCTESIVEPKSADQQCTLPLVLEPIVNAMSTETFAEPSIAEPIAIPSIPKPKPARVRSKARSPRAPRRKTVIPITVEPSVNQPPSAENSGALLNATEHIVDPSITVHSVHASTPKRPRIRSKARSPRAPRRKTIIPIVLEHIADPQQILANREQLLTEQFGDPLKTEQTVDPLKTEQTVDSSIHEPSVVLTPPKKPRIRSKVRSRRAPRKKRVIPVTAEPLADLQQLSAIAHPLVNGSENIVDPINTENISNTSTAVPIEQSCPQTPKVRRPRAPRRKTVTPIAADAPADQQQLFANSDPLVTTKENIIISPIPNKPNGRSKVRSPRAPRRKKVTTITAESAADKQSLSAPHSDLLLIDTEVIVNPSILNTIKAKTAKPRTPRKKQVLHTGCEAQSSLGGNPSISVPSTATPKVRKPRSPRKPRAPRPKKGLPISVESVANPEQQSVDSDSLLKITDQFMQSTDALLQKSNQIVLVGVGVDNVNHRKRINSITDCISEALVSPKRIRCASPNATVKSINQQRSCVLLQEPVVTTTISYPSPVLPIHPTTTPGDDNCAAMPQIAQFKTSEPDATNNHSINAYLISGSHATGVQLFDRDSHQIVESSAPVVCSIKLDSFASVPDAMPSNWNLGLPQSNNIQLESSLTCPVDLQRNYTVDLDTVMKKSADDDKQFTTCSMSTRCSSKSPIGSFGKDIQHPSDDANAVLPETLINEVDQCDQIPTVLQAEHVGANNEVVPSTEELNLDKPCGAVVTKAIPEQEFVQEVDGCHHPREDPSCNAQDVSDANLFVVNDNANVPEKKDLEVAGRKFIEHEVQSSGQCCTGNDPEISDDHHCGGDGDDILNVDATIPFDVPSEATTTTAVLTSELSEKLNDEFATFVSEFEKHFINLTPLEALHLDPELILPCAILIKPQKNLHQFNIDSQYTGAEVDLQNVQEMESIFKASQLASAHVRLQRLSAELIGYHTQDTRFCANNRLLQRPVVMLDRLPSPQPRDESTAYDDDLQPAADLLEDEQEIYECHADHAMRFFQPNLFVDYQPDEDPLLLDALPERKPAYRFNASVVHGMATKHLDQMVNHMPSPASSFGTDQDDEEDNDGQESSVCAAATMVRDSLESCNGTDVVLEYHTDPKLMRMTLSSSSQSSFSSPLHQSAPQNTDENNADDEATQSKKPMNGQRTSPFIEDARPIHGRRHPDIKDKDAEGTGGPMTGNHVYDANTANHVGHDSSASDQSLSHRGTSGSLQNYDGNATSCLVAPLSQMHLNPLNESLVSQQHRKRPRSTTEPTNMVNLTVSVELQNAKSSTVRNQAKRARSIASVTTPNKSNAAATNHTEPPSKSLPRRHIRKPNYLIDYIPTKQEPAASGEKREPNETPTITLQQLREAIDLAHKSIGSLKSSADVEQKSTAPEVVLAALTDPENFTPSDSDRTQIVNIVQLAKAVSTIKATTTSVNSADALGSGPVGGTRQLIGSSSSSSTAAVATAAVQHNKPTARHPTLTNQLLNASVATTTPSYATNKNPPPQHLLQILNAPPSRQLSKTNFTATATNGNILAASSSSSSAASYSTMSNEIPSGNITMANASTSLNTNNLFICKTDGKMIHLTPIQSSNGRAIRTTVATPNTSRNGLITRTVAINGIQAQPHQQSGTNNVLLVTSSANPSTNFVRNTNGNLLPKFTQAFAGNHVVLASSSSLQHHPHDAIGDSGECLVTAAAAQPVIILDSASSNCDLSDATSIVLRETPADVSPSHVYYARKPIVALDAPPLLQQQQIVQNHNQSTPLTIVRSINNEQMVGFRNSTGISRVIVNHNRMGHNHHQVTRCVKVVSSTMSTSTMDTKITTTLAMPRMTIRPTSTPATSHVVNGTHMIRPFGQQRPMLRHLLVTTAAPSQQHVQHQPRFPNGVVVRHPLRNDLLIATNHPNRLIGTGRNQQPTSVQVDTSTLEQLREFDAVLEQVKERSHITPTTSVATSLVSTDAVKSVIRTNTVKHPATTTQQQTLPNIVYKTANGQMVNLSFLPQPQSVSSEQPSLLVVHSKQNPGSQVPNVTLVKPQPIASTSSGVPSPQTKKKPQPDAMMPSPTEPINSPPSAKSTQSTSSSSSISSSASHQSTVTAQKPQEDEQTVQRIYDILAEYAEQLRNSPDLNNKPAPRRRSNPPTNPAGGSNATSSAASSSASAHVSSVTSSISSGTKKRKYAAVPMKSFAQQPTNRNSVTTNPVSTQAAVAPTPTTTTTAAISMDSDDSQCLPTTWTTPLCGDLSPSRSPPSQFTQSAPTNIVQTIVSRPQAAARRQIIFAHAPDSTPTDNNQPPSFVEPSRNFVLTDSASMGKLCQSTVLMSSGNYVLPMGVTVKPGQQIAFLSASNNATSSAAQQPAVNQLQGQPNRIVLKSFLNQQQQHHQTTLTSNANFMSPMSVLDTQSGSTLFIRSTAPRTTRPENHQLQLTSSAFARVPQQQSAGSVATAPPAFTVVEPPASSGHTNFADLEAELTEDEGIAFEADEKKLKLDDGQLDTSEHHQYINDATQSPIHLDAEDQSELQSTSPSLIGLGHDEPTPKSTTLLRFGTPTSPSLDPDLSHRNSKFCMMGNPAGHSLSTQFLLDEHLSISHHHHSSGSSSLSSSSALGSADSGCAPDEGRVLMLHHPASHHPHPQSGAGILAIQERRRVALEREIRLQKSLSEECEDLGVDEPSTSDLFPEAELPFDTGSPPFDLDLSAGTRSTDGTPNAGADVVAKPRIFFGVTKRKVGGATGPRYKDLAH